MAPTTIGLLAPADATFLFLRRSGTCVEYVFCYLKRAKHVCLEAQRPFIRLDFCLLTLWQKVLAVRLGMLKFNTGLCFLLRCVDLRLNLDFSLHQKSQI